MKYLLVDGNDINLRDLSSFMRKLVHRYDTASNGREALEMCSNSPGPFYFILMCTYSSRIAAKNRTKIFDLLLT